MKILIPLDGSEIGGSALPYVNTILSELSPRVKVEFILMRVVPLLTHYVVAGEVATPIFYTEKEMEQIQQEAKDYLGTVSKKVSEKVSVEIVVKIGSAADEILKAADEIGVDLIAMSTHGRHGISRWAFGSVTDKVLRAGGKPVLVVRAPKEGDQK